jgi:hypothetical protein
MSLTTKFDHQSATSRRRRKRVYRFERLESRSLLATAAFNAPSLNDLILAARQGVDTAPAGIERMLTALQTQLTAGPLADLNAGSVDASGFVSEVTTLVSSFAANVDQQLLPEFPHVDRLLQLQGSRIEADLNALSQQNAVGLLSSSALATAAETAINSLTNGPLRPLGTPFSAFVDRTQTFESDLNVLVQGLGASASTPLTIAQVETVLQAEAEAYRADLDGSLYLHPNVAKIVDSAVTSLENQVSSIAQSGGANAQSQVQAAVNSFDAQVLDTTGLFGPSGVIAQSLQHHQGG